MFLGKIKAVTELDIMKKKEKHPVETKSSEIIDETISKTSETVEYSDDNERLIDLIKSETSQTIRPIINFNDDKILYPILEKINQSQDNLEYLDDLVDKGILEKQFDERLVVCPLHPQSYSSNIRLSCPKCHSFDVLKLNLFEHIKCGHISEGLTFKTMNGEIKKCPSCNKEIKNFEKEIKIPALWYQCNNCHGKFDNVVLKLHCRKYEHDFDISSAQFVSLYCYKIKDSQNSLDSDSITIQKNLADHLEKKKYEIAINTSIKGKNGSHNIPLLVENKVDQKKALIYIKTKKSELDLTDINSVIMTILDVGPSNTIIISKSRFDEQTSVIAKTYGVRLVMGEKIDEITNKLEQILEKGMRL